MVEQLRDIGARPQLVVDARGHRVDEIGTPGPLGRERCVYALPLGGSNPQHQIKMALINSGKAYLADPDGTVVGADGVWISRLLYARWTEDTRRLG